MAVLEEEEQQCKEQEEDEEDHGGSRDLARAARQRRLARAVHAAAAHQRAQRQDGEQPASASSSIPAGAGRGGGNSKGIAPAASQGKFGAVEALVFVDAAAVAPQLRGPPADGNGSADEWHLAVLLEHRVVLVNILGGQHRHLLPFDLQKQTPTALVALSTRFLALGCGDGQVRVWDAWRWELAAPAYPAHSREVRHLRALLPSSTAQQHLRVLSLGLEGSALLWHAPVVYASSSSAGGVDIDPRGLRPVMRLEGVCVR